MTTIATDGKTICADSQQGTGSHIHPINAVKLFRVGGVVYGGSGVHVHCLSYYEWIKNGCPDDNKPDESDDWDVLFVKNGKAFLVTGSLIPVEVGLPASIGSGGPYAMAAMLAGTSPKAAVQIAIKLDDNSGGKIRTMKC